MRHRLVVTVVPSLALLGALALAGTPRARAAAAYTITDLGTLGGPTSRATELNARGQVVGFSTTAPGQQLGQAGTRAFLWDNGVMTDLGTLGGATSSTSGINARGQVAGTAATASGEDHAFLWDRGVMTDLGTLGGALSSANRINDAGQVVGQSTTAPGQRLTGPGAHAFLWAGGRMTDLGALPGPGDWSRAIGVNAAGQVVGISLNAEGALRAVRWDSGRIAELGTLPGYPASRALRIDDRGRVAGWAETAGATPAAEPPDLRVRAFLYQNGAMTDLGTLPGFASSRATGLNAAGQVVGIAARNPGTGGPRRAVLWERGVPTDLNSLLPPGSGWELTMALGINDAGQIVGGGTIGGQEHAYLLTPATPPGLPSTGGGGGEGRTPRPGVPAAAGGLLAALLGVALRATRRPGRAA